MDVLKKTIFTEQIFVSNGEPTEVSTILGSCVAVCLYDPILKIVGMNHYLLPLWNGEGLKSLKYGNICNERLIEKMLKAGAKKSRMIVKLFGGAKINIAGLNIGEKNVIIAKKIIEEHGLKITSEDTGGFLGRKIIMNSTDGSVYLKYAADRRKQDRRDSDRRKK